MAQHRFNFRLMARDDSTLKRTELKTRMAGEDRFVTGRKPKPVARIEIG
jgi:hypothetical protein